MLSIRACYIPFPLFSHIPISRERNSRIYFQRIYVITYITLITAFIVNYNVDVQPKHIFYLMERLLSPISVTTHSIHLQVKVKYFYLQRTHARNIS
jgi:hypothetical protein